MNADSILLKDGINRSIESRYMCLSEDQSDPKLHLTSPSIAMKYARISPKTIRNFFEVGNARAVATVVQVRACVCRPSFEVSSCTCVSLCVYGRMGSTNVVV